MTRLLQIGLMVLTAALCGVCLLQWQRESRLTRGREDLAVQLHASRETLAAQAAQLDVREAEIARLNAALGESAKDRPAVAELESAATARARAALEAALGEQTDAAETARTQLKQALDERDSLATRLNQRTMEFNTLAEKYRKAR